MRNFQTLKRNLRKKKRKKMKKKRIKRKKTIMEMVMGTVKSQRKRKSVSVTEK